MKRRSLQALLVMFLALAFAFTPASVQPSFAEAQSAKSTAASCVGRSGGDKYWWGVRVFLDSCQADQLRRQLSGTGNAAGVCLVIPLPFLQLPCAIVAASTFLAAGQIEEAASAGRGVWIDWNPLGWITAVQPQ